MKASMSSVLIYCIFFLQILNVRGILNQYEQVYMGLPNRTLAREYLFDYTSHPHIAGSPGDYDTAVYTLNKFLSFGLNASIVTHKMYANYPLQRQLQLVDSSGQILFAANMTEPVVSVDPTSDEPTIVPTFNGYSASGNTSARLVYASYGRIQDFQYLQSVGVNITGAVVIVRYGKVFRGVKAMLAQQFGASGLLIYSDPADDGFVRAGGENNTYPTGPWRPEYGVQRGSVQFLPICPGSPSQDRVKVCRGEEHENDPFVGALIPNIPVQPISWGDALPLLMSLENTTAAPNNTDWQGGLNFTYSLGPSNLSVNFALVMNYTTVDIWNVIATLSGQRSDEIVLLGNHRDAWVFGATDPNSGSSAMLEVARSLALLKNTTSWVPERDIVFCSWDAEEYGLIGSTAWGELNAADLQERAIAYVNTDVGVSGNFLDVGGTPSLWSLIGGVAGDIPYPGNTSMPLNEHLNTSAQLGILGSGSDYTVFLDHLGIPSLDIGYGSYEEAGVYHSIYDSFYWMDHFGDPGFIFHEGLAQLLGIILIRLSDSQAHPLNFTNYAGQLEAYLQSIQGKANGADFSALAAAIDSFAQAGNEIDAQSACVVSNSSCVTGIDVEALNTRLRLSERRMLLNAISNSTDGLPYRPWYKHAIQAPGIYLGYGSQTFPGIMQGIIDNNTALIQQQITKAAIAISDAASALTELSVNGISTPGKCYGDSLGSIQLVARGGFSPVYYSFNGTYWSLSNTLSNLPAGSYPVYVQDSLGFNASILVNVSQPQKLEIEVELKGSKAKAVVSGGVGNYTIRWSTNETLNDIELANKGNYSVSVTDNNGCFASTTFTYSPKHKGLSAGGVVGIVIAVLVLIGAIVAILFFIRRRNRTIHYQNL